MHHSGAAWLTRSNRDAEENTTLLLSELNLQKGQTVCDLGAGNGYWTLRLAEGVGPAGSVLAVDIQSEMLQKLDARARAANLKNIQLIQGELNDPKLPAASLDLILLVDVYHEFSDPEAMLAAMRRALKPTGRIVLVEYREEDPDVPIRPLHKMSKAQMVKEYAANGFKVVDVFDGLPWQHVVYFARDDSTLPAVNPDGITGPAKDRLVAPGATLQPVITGLDFVDGPANAPDGSLWFVEVKRSKIHRLAPDGSVTLIDDDSGNTSGLYFADNGNLIATENGRRRITERAPDGRVTVIADSYDGKKISKPNDLWVAPNGAVYFTDNRPGGRNVPPDIEQTTHNVVYISPDRKTKTSVINDFVGPNGIIGSADGKWLYPTDRRGGVTYAYPIKADGTLGTRRELAPVGSDGMTLDHLGNIYMTLADKIVVYTPEGEHLLDILMHEPYTSVCLGGPDGKTLYISGRTTLWSLKMKVKAAR
jgi:sugar lactone lactonase YvrE/precorrin-6B methylase 2